MVMGLVATAAVLGMAARGFLAPPGSTPSGATQRPVTGAGPAAGAEPTGPRAVEAGVPVGFARTPEGAVAAAAAFVRTGQALLDMDSAEVEAAVRTMAAEGAADAQLADTGSRLAAAHEALAGSDAPIEYHQAVLAVRVDAYTARRARVSVWNVGVLSREGIAPPQAGWAISSFELVWERGDWKVWAETIAPGPAPITNNAVPPATSAQLRERLAGFSDYGALG
jgi:hypothetical protein